GQRRQGADGAAVRCGQGGGEGSAGGDRDGEPLAVSRTRSETGADAAGVLPAVEASGAGGGSRSGACVAACAAALVRVPHAGAGRRFAQPADAAGARGYLDGADLHSCPDRAAAQGGGGPSSVVEGVD